MSKTTWREEITVAFGETGDTWEKVVSCTLSDEEMDVEFEDGFGCSEGTPFTLWTRKYVYFPVVYDGAEWVSWVSRKPDGVPTHHIGGQ